MALRLPVKRLLAAQSGCTKSLSRCFASAVAVPVTEPQESYYDIQKESLLPNPDPASDSPTAAMISDFTPFMVATYKRPPPIMVTGEGCYIWDIENRRYLDFTAGIAVNALGHCDPEMSKLLYQQSQTLVHASNLYHNAWTGSASKLIVEKTRAAIPKSLASKVFFCNSGTEANEAAIKFARKVGKIRDPSGRKTEIVSCHNSFHGRTMGALSATPNEKYQKPFAPMIPGFKYMAYNAMEEIDQTVDESTCGVIIEPIQGEGGVMVADAAFMQALRDRCTAVGAVLIYDEIQCGLSRTGRFWAHAWLPETAQPDIITSAKALGNGFPVGATIVSEDVARCVVTGDHGTTYGGNPLACRLAHYTVSRLSARELQADVLKKEKIFRSGLEQLRRRFSNVITEIRGRGLILGVQLNQDPTPIVTAARERGLLVITGGVNTLRLVPPLIIGEREITEGLEILGKAMEVVFEGQGPVEGTMGQQEMAPEGR